VSLINNINNTLLHCNNDDWELRGASILLALAVIVCTTCTPVAANTGNVTVTCYSYVTVTCYSYRIMSLGSTSGLHIFLLSTDSNTWSSKYYRVAQNILALFVLLITSSNVDKFSNFFHCQKQEWVSECVSEYSLTPHPTQYRSFRRRKQICKYYTITKDPTAP